MAGPHPLGRRSGPAATAVLVGVGDGDEILERLFAPEGLDADVARAALLADRLVVFERRLDVLLRTETAG